MGRAIEGKDGRERPGPAGPSGPRSFFALNRTLNCVDLGTTQYSTKYRNTKNENSLKNTFKRFSEPHTQGSVFNWYGGNGFDVRLHQSRYGRVSCHDCFRTDAVNPWHLAIYRPANHETLLVEAKMPRLERLLADFRFTRLACPLTRARRARW